MTSIRIGEAAAALLEAEHRRTELPALTDSWGDLDVATAYSIQDEVMRRKVDQLGERIVGIKLGLTSSAKQRQMNLNSPIVGWLTDRMELVPDEKLDRGRFIHPRCEPEIAFVMDGALEGPGITPAQALAAVRAVHGGIEIIDSRYLNFRFTLPDVIADNASASAFYMTVKGLAPVTLDLRTEACLVERNGEVAASATGAAIQGHPAIALAAAANDLAARGRRIEPGWIVLTGGMTDAVAIGPRDFVMAQFSTIGTLSVR